VCLHLYCLCTDWIYPDDPVGQLDPLLTLSFRSPEMESILSGHVLIRQVRPLRWSRLELEAWKISFCDSAGSFLTSHVNFKGNVEQHSSSCPIEKDDTPVSESVSLPFVLHQ
jgi:hypothetical protein